MSQTVADVLVGVLEQTGVKQIFGLIGDFLNPLADALRRSHIEWIGVRHEEGAALAAAGQAKLTGQLAVCAGTTGPRSTHLVAGLYEASLDHAPVLALSGDMPRKMQGIEFIQTTKHCTQHNKRQASNNTTRGYCNLTSGNLSEVCGVRPGWGHPNQGYPSLVFQLRHTYGDPRMDKRHDTVLETLMEQLIEGGAENMGLVFARVFDLAMQIERERFLGAQHYERSPSRQGYANGYKAKRIDTPAGTVTVNVPKTAGHDGEPFYPQSLERGFRSTRAVMMREFGIESLSSSQVSRAAKLIDDELEAWRNRPLGEIKYLILDARYEKMRHAGIVRDVAVLAALAMVNKAATGWSHTDSVWMPQ